MEEISNDTNWKEEYDNIFKELTSDSTLNLDHETISRRIASLFSGYLLPTIQLDEIGSELYVYRVTDSYPSLNDNITKPKSFSFPENPSLGRANIKNKPVFYCSPSLPTAISEMKEFNNKPYYLSKWKLKFTKRTYAVIWMNNIDPDNSIDSGIFGRITQDAIDSIFIGKPIELKEQYKYKLKILGDLFTAESEKYYPITSAIGYQAIYKLKEAGVFSPILIYPSIKTYLKDVNFAIEPTAANNIDFLELESVIKTNITVDRSIFKYELISKAKNVLGELEWKDKKPDKTSLVTDEIRIRFKGERDIITIKSGDYIVCDLDFECSLISYLQENQSLFEDQLIPKIDQFFDDKSVYHGQLCPLVKTDIYIRLNEGLPKQLDIIGVKVNRTISFCSKLLE